MKKIKIQHEANIKAEGKLNSKHCKPVICLETGDVYSSVTDAAEAIGCYAPDISAHLTGRKRTIKGKHFCYLSRVSESLDAIVTRLRETAAVEADAKKWREHQAKLDAARKEEERRQQAIAKAEAKVAALTEACTKYENKWREATSALNEAEMELEALRDNNNVAVA